MTRDAVTRRRLLASIAAGTASFAGCGYQPAGGELAWAESVGSGAGLTNDSDERWIADGAFLYRISNRSGRGVTFDGPGGSSFTESNDARVTAYDSRGRRVRRGSTDAQYAGEPAIAAGRVYLPLADGSVTALDRSESDAEADSSDGYRSDETAMLSTLWTTAWTAPDDGSGDDLENGADDGPETSSTEASTDGTNTTETSTNGTSTNETRPTDETETVTSLAMAAGSDLVVGVHDAGVVAFDAATGDERFAFRDDDLGVTSIDSGGAAGDRAWLVATGPDDEPVAMTIDTDGTVRTAVALPSSPDWLETTGTESTVILAIEDELWAFDAAGEQRFTMGIDRRAAPLIVGDRLYYTATGSVAAIDLEAGEFAWRRDGYWFESVAADADGVYAVGTAPDMDDCGLLALTADGEPWWQVPMLEDAGCDGDLFPIEDRLVFGTDDGLYGFHREPGPRYTIL